MSHCTADHGRQIIARLVLGDEARTHTSFGTGRDDAPHRVGSVILRPHQRSAVARVRQAFDEFGGALLADEVGLGKTYVALALAAAAARVCVVAPAGLRAMWAAAAHAADVRLTFASVEALSRDRAPPPPFDLLVVDEAHHFRNPATRRYREAGTLATGARVLLLSATPVHNRRADLHATLALFLGGRAAALTPAELARCVVRRARDDVRDPVAIPPTRPPEWVPIPHDEATLDQILALPPPVPPRDGGDGGALLAHSLVRQWASSDAALAGALRRRLARAAALEQALASGRHPSRAELRAWAFAGDAVQLAFAELLCDGDPAADILGAVHQHAEAARALLRGLTGRADVARARALGALRDRHAGEKIVAFSGYADTVAALFSLLRAHPGVGALTARGGLVAGGALGRDELLRRFAPTALGARPPGRADHVDLLVATDLLSEGVNLQDASVVVHLDLPWTPARLAQRVGRAARLGSAHASVAVYVLSPPASAERLLAVERLLRAKASAAGRAVGVAGCILPSLTAPDALACGDAHPPSSASALAELARSTLGEWLARDVDGESSPDVALRAMSPLTAAVQASRAGFLAACDVAGRVQLVASVAAPGGRRSLPAASTHPRVVAEAAQAANGHDAAPDERRLQVALASVRRWCAAHRAATDAGVGDAAWAPARRHVLERIAAIVRRAPHHRRPAVLALAAGARRAALLPGGAGAERVLDELARAPLPDDAWLRAVGAYGDAQPPIAPEATGPVPAPRLLALLVLQPAEAD